VSAGLSVAHLRPRSSLGYVLWLNWLTRAVFGWLVALPLIAAVGASGIGALPQADRALFESGGLWLVELSHREAHALSAGLRAGLGFALVALVLRMPVTALLFFATHDPKASLSVAFRRALAGFRRFLGLSVLDLLARALLIALTLLAARSFGSLIPRPANEALADLGPLLVGLGGALLMALLAVFFECCRANAAASPKLSFGALFGAATGMARSCGFELFASYLLYVGASALLLAAGARGVEALDVSRAGALRVASVSLLHQGALLGLCLLQGAWVRRVVGLVQPGPDSPSALR
jgi:hypothetical protein